MGNAIAYINSIMPAIVMNDSIGATIFIIIVFVWYSSSFVVLLGMQTRTSTEIMDDSTKGRNKLFVQTLRDQSYNKEVLKELVDKQKRDKLWDIYLGTSGDVCDKLTRAEILRIRNIEKQLATINKHPGESSERTVDDSFINCSSQDSWSSIRDLTSLNLRPRRRSSVDHRILQEFKILSDELKTHESWPWAIQKLFIRRHLRRQR